MLAYAAGRPLVGKRQPSPHAMLFVIAAHVGLIAGVMSAKMDLPKRVSHRPIVVDLLPEPVPPPPNMVPKTPPPGPAPIAVDQPTDVSMLRFDKVPVGPAATRDPGSVAGDGVSTVPAMPGFPISEHIRHEPRLLTPASELKPPYPTSKLLSEEEATLKLRLTISESGRVTAVDPVGTADREFLDSARRYLIAHWRYQPATEDGRAIVSFSVITLRFQLDG